MVLRRCLAEPVAGRPRKMAARRGQAVLESMVVLGASLCFLVILLPSYQSAFSLSSLCVSKSDALAAASALGGAVSLAKSLGEGSSVNGEVEFPSGATVRNEGNGIVLAVPGIAGAGGMAFEVASDCALDLNCSSRLCAFTASVDFGSCNLRVYGAN